jgi:hypothetical protein
MDLTHLQNSILQITHIVPNIYTPIYTQVITSSTYATWKKYALVWQNHTLHIPEDFVDILHSASVNLKAKYTSVLLLVFRNSVCASGHVCILLFDTTKKQCYKYDPAYSLHMVGKVDYTLRALMRKNGFTYDYNKIGIHATNCGQHCLDFIKNAIECNRMQ